MAESVMHAGRHPIEGIGNRRPAADVGALRTSIGIARGVVPSDVRAEGPLVVDHAERDGLGRGGVNRPGGGARLVVALAGRVCVLSIKTEAVRPHVLPDELVTVIGALGP